MQELRAEFPVFERLAYLNAGSNGPVPRRAVEAAAESMRRQVVEGRGDRSHFEETIGRSFERTPIVRACEAIWRSRAPPPMG